MSSLTSPSPLSLFYSYSHKDEPLRDQLEIHLTLLKRQGLIQPWHDRCIMPGEEWSGEIDANLESADIILLLISPDFVASDYCHEIEMRRAMERHQADEARVVPIVLRPGDYQGAAFMKLQGLPKNFKAVTTWENQDEAFQDVSEGLRRVIKQIQEKQKSAEAIASLKLIGQDAVEAERGIEAVDSPTQQRSKAMPRVDLHEAQTVESCYGRDEILDALAAGVIDQRWQVVALIGQGGIGKTTIAVKLVEQLKDQFEYVVWRSLKNALPIGELLEKLIRFLHNETQETLELKENINSRIDQLMQYLRDKRCLVILDNVETIFQGGEQIGQYRSGHEAYGQLLTTLSQRQHKSCLMLTSREQPPEIATLATEQILRIEGLKGEDANRILQEKGLKSGTEVDYQRLVEQCSGNPLALQLIPNTIKEYFGGNIATFLGSGVIPPTLEGVLSHQFERLIQQEQHILYWLAVNREETSLAALRDDLANSISLQRLISLLQSLRERSLVEISEQGFTLQPIVMQYTTQQLVEQTVQEIKSGKITLFNQIALMKAQAHDYVRAMQVRIIVNPVLEQFPANQVLETKLRGILADLRQDISEVGYAAGNILNLFIQCGISLEDCDFSNLAVWQADLRSARISSINFTKTDFTKSRFVEPLNFPTCVAFSPDGKVLAVSGSWNGDINLWLTENMQPYITLKGHTKMVFKVVFSPDGQQLASGGEDGTLKIWDLSTRRCLNTIQDNTEFVVAIAFDPSGQILASTGRYGYVSLWNANTGKCLKILQKGGIFDGSDSMFIKFSYDGKLLASCGEDYTIKLWSTQTGETVSILRGHTDYVSAALFHVENDTLITAGRDKAIKLWNIKTGNCVQTLNGHVSSIREISLSQDGRILASCSDVGEIKIWNFSTGECTDSLSGHTAIVRSVSINPDQTLLASASDDLTVKLWDLLRGRCLTTLQGRANWIWSIAISSDGSKLASGHEDSTINIWDLRTRKWVKALRHSGRVWSIAFAPQAEMLFSASDDFTVKHWDINTGECLHSEPTTRSLSVAVNCEGKILALSARDEPTITLWDISIRQHLCTIKTCYSPTIDFSSDGFTLASGGMDGIIKLWDARNGNQIQTLCGHESSVNSVSFNSSGTHLASGSEDKTIKLWDINAGTCMQTYEGHTDRVEAVTFDHTNQIIASGSDDKTIRLWNISNRECLMVLYGHTDRIGSLAFSPDGHVLFSGSMDGTIRCWNITTGRCLDILRLRQPYEGMIIKEARGLTEVQRATLLDLGAVE